MYLGGSVEAACALGVADGIVDLVGPCCRVSVACGYTLTYICRVWRDDEESWTQSHPNR